LSGGVNWPISSIERCIFQQLGRPTSPAAVVVLFRVSALINATARTGALALALADGQTDRQTEREIRTRFWYDEYLMRAARRGAPPGFLASRLRLLQQQQHLVTSCGERWTRGRAPLVVRRPD